MLTIIFSDTFIVIILPILLIICFLYAYWSQLKNEHKKLIKELEDSKTKFIENKTLNN